MFHFPTESQHLTAERECFGSKQLAISNRENCLSVYSKYTPSKPQGGELELEKKGEKIPFEKNIYTIRMISISSLYLSLCYLRDCLYFTFSLHIFSLLLLLVVVLKKLVCYRSYRMETSTTKRLRYEVSRSDLNVTM